ncbi:MAG: hypothetical protein E7453_04925 [Ruminococcaceae bacterium]|nr:hypothetical protein [Oscillospiraceae bacterium]
MSCLNCNRETVGKAVFCEACQAEMESYPIPKGTPVVIPLQPSPVSFKKQGMLLLGSLEEEVQALKKRSRRLSVCLLIALFFLLITAGALAYCLMYGIPDYVTDIPKQW